MFAVRPVAGRLSCRAIATCPSLRSASKQPRTTPCNGFHSSSRRPARRPAHRRASTERRSEVMSPEAVAKFSKEKFPEYTAEELKALGSHYSAEHMEALAAGEAAIDPHDLTRQGKLRTDPYVLPYMEDFAAIRPVVDKRPGKKAPPADPRTRWMTSAEFGADFARWGKEQIPGLSEDMSDAEIERLVGEAQLDDVEILKWWRERPAVTTGDAAADAEVAARLASRDSSWGLSAMAPALPDKIPGVAGLYTAQADPDDEGRDPEGVWQELKRATGLPLRVLQGLSVKPLVTRFVSNQTRLGNVRSASVLSIAGNGDGWLGLGEARSTEHQTAIEKSRLNAIRNVRPIRRYEDRTIYGNVEMKVSGSVVQLFARPPGFGLRVSHRIFEICRIAGIHDLAAKMPRSRNPMNTVKATVQALMSQPDPEEIAMGRGKKLVDARKVYYGGSVY